MGRMGRRANRQLGRPASLQVGWLAGVMLSWSQAFRQSVFREARWLTGRWLLCTLLVPQSGSKAAEAASCEATC